MVSISLETQEGQIFVLPRCDTSLLRFLLSEI